MSSRDQVKRPVPLDFSQVPHPNNFRFRPVLRRPPTPAELMPPKEFSVPTMIQFPQVQIPVEMLHGPTQSIPHVHPAPPRPRLSSYEFHEQMRTCGLNPVTFLRPDDPSLTISERLQYHANDPDQTEYRRLKEELRLSCSTSIGSSSLPTPTTTPAPMSDRFASSNLCSNFERTSRPSGVTRNPSTITRARQSVMKVPGSSKSRVEQPEEKFRNPSPSKGTHKKRGN
ncbi:hypothetical protein K435DRAFT_867864 [Dendrothele bispora CBS 962.96]|uniref:Uncharacterized protein n=1 Tax=Dendrothele bispora (strain CBS 962.96) TaxID=1314807 RepID=A0A4S8LD21_DENBC|nr:hypothetical protein K435DRAFT_867864 [Dendrothele bispora CBS 962.96]